MAFAVTTFIEEVRIAVKANSGINSIKDLNGKNVATTTGTTSVQTLRRHERAEIGRRIECGELRAACRVFFVQRVGRQAELAGGRVQRIETRFDLREPFGIEIDALRIVLQRIDGFLQLDLGRFERRERVAERGVVVGEAAQLRHDRAELREHRVVGLGQRVKRTAHAFDQVRRMRQALVLVADFVPFAGLRRELVEFGELPGELFAFELQLALVRFGCLDRLRRVAPHAPCARDVRGIGDEARVRIEQLALRIGPHQQLVRMLAVDVDEHFAKLAQLRERRAGAVDERARPAVRIDHAAQHHGVLGVERVFVEPARDAVVRREFGGDVGAAAAGAHDARVGTFAEREGEGVDQDRFPGAGFTGKDGKAAVEFEIERGDDDEVADREVAEHDVGQSGVRTPCRLRSRRVRSSAASCAALRSNCSRSGAGTAPCASSGAPRSCRSVRAR